MKTLELPLEQLPVTLPSQVNISEYNPLTPYILLKEGKYILGEKIETGGMSTTYKATNLTDFSPDGEDCVIKEMLDSTPNAEEFLKQEAKQLNKIKHPNIPSRLSE